MDLYIRCTIRLHGVVLNLLSTGTTLPFTLPYLFGTQDNFSLHEQFIGPFRYA
jgi:hypothetical protein